MIAMDCSHIKYVADISKIDLTQLVDLFDLGAFWAQGRRPEDLQVAIALLLSSDYRLGWRSPDWVCPGHFGWSIPGHHHRM